MKKLVSLLLFTSFFLGGCHFFESDRYYSCVESQPNEGNKFSLIVGGKTIKVGRIEYERCNSEKTSIMFSDNCKDIMVGYMGNIELVTGEFHSTVKDTPDSKVKNYTKGICSRVEKI